MECAGPCCQGGVAAQQKQQNVPRPGFQTPRLCLSLPSPTPIRALQVRAGIHKPSQGKVDERWRAFMKFQIKRARQYFKEAEDGVDYLDVKARWPVW